MPKQITRTFEMEYINIMNKGCAKWRNTNILQQQIQGNIRIYIFMPSPFGFVPELRQTTFKVVNQSKLVWKKEHSRRQMETLKQRME